MVKCKGEKLLKQLMLEEKELIYKKNQEIEFNELGKLQQFKTMIVMLNLIQ